jgi:hypothetical protein
MSGDRLPEANAFLKAQRDFHRAAVELLDAWYDLQGVADLEELAVRDYPFDEDFAEVVARIHEWNRGTEQEF